MKTFKQKLLTLVIMLAFVTPVFCGYDVHANGRYEYGSP